MNAQQALAFGHLLTAWNRREDARLSGDLAALGAARMQLDEQRAQMRVALAGRR